MHVPYKAQHFFKGLPLLGSSTALSVLIFPMRQQNKGLMRTTITKPGCWCLAGSTMIMKELKTTRILNLGRKIPLLVF